jgi:hypothetical protein
MQDIGNFGYRYRTVEVLYITKYFMIAKNIFEDQDIKNRIEWEKVDIEVNEMGFDSGY